MCGMIDCGDLFVLFGIVDLYGDVFECVVMLCFGVVFFYEIVLVDVDG